MKSTVEAQTGLYRKLSIEVPAEKVTAAFDRVYKDLQKNATLKGFRKGKAPISQIKATYGESVKNDVLQEIFQENYSQAVQEHKLQPVTRPEVKFDGLLEGAPFKFTARFEVHPTVEVKKYENLKVEKEQWSFDEKSVDNILNNYREQSAELVTVFEDRPAQSGDTAIIDFLGKLDGVPFPGGAGNDYSLELGSNSFIPGFEDGILGMTIGGFKPLKLRFPDDYTPDLAGKEVVFDVTLKALKKKALPELNDEFAKKLGGFETVEDMKKDIRARITEQETRRVQGDLRSRVVRALVEANPVEVPEQIQREESQAMIDDAWKTLSQRGMNESQFEEYKAKWEKEFNDAAAVKVKANFLVMALSEKMGLGANNEELNARIEKYAKQLGMEPAKVRDYYAKSGGLSGLQYQIIEEKVVEALIKTADIKEVPKEKLADASE
jgi:trigger factor